MSTASTSTSNDASAEEVKTEEQQTPTNGSGDASSGGNAKYAGITRLRNFLSNRRLELGMLVSRIACVYFAVFYLIPIFGRTASFLQRALISNAITSGIRLYQRVGGTPCSLSKEFIAHLIIEDSCHYLFYSLIFMYCGSVSFSLVPVVLFSSLHVASFTLQMLEIAKGPTARFSGFGSLLYSLTSRTPWVLKFAATTEIALMIVIILNCFQGNISIVTPFAYYRFLYLRYASKRNQYTRLVFYEIRMAAEAIIAKGCPVIMARLIKAGISILCRLAPKTSNQ